MPRSVMPQGARRDAQTGPNGRPTTQRPQPDTQHLESSGADRPRAFLSSLSDPNHVLSSLEALANVNPHADARTLAFLLQDRVSWPVSKTIDAYPAGALEFVARAVRPCEFVSTPQAPWARSREVETHAGFWLDSTGYPDAVWRHLVALAQVCPSPTSWMLADLLERQGHVHTQRAASVDPDGALAAAACAIRSVQGAMP